MLPLCDPGVLTGSYNWSVILDQPKTLAVVLLMMGLGGLLAGQHAWQRWAFDRRDSKVTVAVAWEDLEQLAGGEGGDAANVLQRWSQRRLLQTLIISEDTLSKLAADGRLGWAHVDGQSVLPLLAQPDLGARVTRHELFFTDSALRGRVKQRLSQHLGTDRVRDARAGRLQVSASALELQSLGLGFASEPLARARENRLGVVLRYRNNPRLSPEQWSAIWQSDLRATGAHVLLFGGEEVGGFPHFSGRTGALLRGSPLLFGIIEFSQQDGASEFARAARPNVIRVHSIPVAEMSRYQKTGWRQRYLRAARERRARLLVVHPYVDPRADLNLLRHNEELLADLQQGLERTGMPTVSAAQLVPLKWTPAGAAQRVILAGVSALLFFGFYRPGVCRRYSLFWAGMGLLVLPTVLSEAGGGWPTWNATMAAITAAMVPLIAMLWILDSVSWLKASVSRKLLAWLGLLGFCVLGGLWVGIWTGDLDHLLSVQPFRGVKFSFLLPILVLSLAYGLRREHWRSWRFFFRRWAAEPLSKLELILGTLVLAGLLLVILRSGNYINVEIPAIETKLRDGLEQLFGIRPRGKEILLGYPFLWMALSGGWERVSGHRQGLWAAVAALAPISVINSFCHFHTPLLITLQRTLLGAALGLLLGILATPVFRVLARLYDPS